MECLQEKEAVFPVKMNRNVLFKIHVHVRSDSVIIVKGMQLVKTIDASDHKSWNSMSYACEKYLVKIKVLVQL